MKPGQARVIAPKRTFEVRDISASGSGMLLSPREVIDLDASGLMFELDGDLAFTTRLDVVRSYQRDGGLHVGTRFLGLDVAGLEHLSRFLIREFVVQNQRYSRLSTGRGPVLSHQDPELIARLLRFYTVAERRQLRVYAGDQPLPLRLRVATVDPGELVATAVAGDLSLLRAHSECGFLVGGNGAACYFRAAVVAVDQTTVAIAMPTEIQQAGFRDSMRPQLPIPNDVVVEFRHPRLADRTLVKSIVDIAGRGFAFALEPHNDLLFPGDQIPSAQLRFGGLELPIRAIVRSIAPQLETGLICGLEILRFASREDARNWHNFVFHCAHPHLEIGRRTAAQRAWGVLASSEYVSLWTPPDHRGHLAGSFFESWSNPSDRVGHLLLLSNQHGTVGTVAGSLLYPRTWMVHHLGVDRRQRHSRPYFLGLARELYSGIMYMIQHLAELDFFVIFVEDQKRWTTLLYRDFVDQYPHPKQFVYDEFRAFKCNIGAAKIVDDDPTSRFMIGRASAEQLGQLSDHMVATTSPLEVEAMGLDRANVDLRRFATDCAKHGYERSRTVFVAVEGDRLSAALIAETGAEGVNIFGLMNRAWFVNLDPEGAIDEEIKHRLLQAAIRHYRDAGKRLFVLLDEPGSPAIDQPELGLVHVSKGVRWLARRELVPAWLSYVDDLLGMQSVREEQGP